MAKQLTLFDIDYDTNIDTNNLNEVNNKDKPTTLHAYFQFDDDEPIKISTYDISSVFSLYLNGGDSITFQDDKTNQAKTFKLFITHEEQTHRIISPIVRRCDW